MHKVVIKHVFKRSQLHGTVHGVTHGPRIPKWSHVNPARDIILNNVAASRRQWTGLSVQMCNPYAVPGSPGGLNGDPDSKSNSETSLINFMVNASI